MSSVPVPQVPAATRPKGRWKAILLRIAVALFVVWLGFVGFVWWSMNQTPEKFATVMSRMPGPAVFLLAPFETMWVRARAGGLQAGDIAPEFNLTTLDKTSKVALSSLRERGPVVLVFGSYT